MLCDGVGVLPLVSDPQGMRVSTKHLHKQYYYMDGDLNDKPTAMRSRSMARSQSWTTVYKGPDRLLRMMFTTDNNQPWKLKPAVGKLVLAFWAATKWHWLKRKSWMDPGRDPTAGFSFQGWLLSVL